MSEQKFVTILLVIGLIIIAGGVWYFAANQQIPKPSVPIIERIIPDEATIGAEISVRGSGFTADKNSVQFGDGFSYINNLTSPDGKTIKFSLPESFDTCNPDGNACAELLSRPVPGHIYEVAVINANGRSNSVNFTVAHPIVIPDSVPYKSDGTCPPGYVNYGVPLECVTQDYAKYCKTNLCPICLSGNTLIDTPSGPIAVKDLRIGMPMWTTDTAGDRIRGVVIKTSKVPALPTHQMVHLVLDDGRELFASPGHPIIDGRSIGGYS